MLTSQTSSSSLASGSSAKHDETADSNLFPEKFKTNCLLARKVLLHDDELVNVIISTSLELIECKGREVVNYINLKCHLPAESRSSTSVNFSVIIQQGRSNSVVYALKINSALVALERRASQLKVLNALTRVNSCNLTLDEFSRQPAFLVVYEDGSETVTDFLDLELGCMRREKRFAGIYESVNQKTKVAGLQLAKLNEEIEKLSLKMLANRSFLPKLMIEDVSRTVCDT